MSKLRTLAKWILGILLLSAAAFYVGRFTYTDFQRVRLKLPTESMASVRGGVVVRFDARGIPFRQGQNYILECLSEAGGSRIEARVSINQEPPSKLSLGPGKRRTYATLSGILPGARNRLELRLPAGEVSILGLEIKNIYGFSTGPFGFHLAAKSGSKNPAVIQNRMGRLLVTLLVFVLALLAWSLKATSPDPASRRQRRLLRIVAGLCLFLILVPPLLLLLPQKFQVFISQSYFLLLCLAAFACSAYSRDPHAHRTLAVILKQTWARLLAFLQRHGFDRRYGLYVLLLPTFFLVVYLFLNIHFYMAPHEESGDIAVNALQVERVKRFAETLGPYSRFGFHHPGPASFYYFAAMEKLLPFIPTSPGRHLLAQLLLNFLFLFLSLHILYRSFGRGRSVLLLFCSLLFVLSAPTLGGDILSRTWPPHMLIFPMLTFVIALASVSRGELRHSFPAALALVFLAQNNVSSLAIVAPFLLAALALIAWSWKRHGLVFSRKEKTALLLSLLFLVVAFLPPLVEQFTSETGNMTRIVRFFSARGGSGHTFEEACDFVFGYFRAPLALSNHSDALLMILLSFLVVLNVTRSRHYINYLIFYLFLGLLLALYSATRIPGPLLQYILIYMVAFVALFYFLAAQYLLSLLPLEKGNRKALALFLVGAVFLMAMGYYRTTTYFPPSKSEAMRQALAPSKEVSYELYLDNGGPHHEQWGHMAGLALNMVRKGYRVYVTPEWESIFGADMVNRGTDKTVHRVSFYSADKHAGRAREHEFTCLGTTIEFGDLLLLQPPIRLGPGSPDEYFENWNPSDGRSRQKGPGAAKVLIPLDGRSTPTSQGWLLHIIAQSSMKKEIMVKLNARLLSRLPLQVGQLDVSIPVESSWLRFGGLNTIVIEDEGATGQPFAFDLKAFELLPAPL